MIILLSIIKSLDTQLNLLLSVISKFLLNPLLSLTPENLRALFHNNIPVIVIEPILNNCYSNNKSSTFHLNSRVT